MSKYFKILDDFKLSNSKTLHETIKQFDQPAIEDLHQAVEKYHQENLSATAKEVQHREGFNIYPSRIPSPLNLQFLRAASLYSDKLIIWDPLDGILSGLQKGFSPEGIKHQLSYSLPELLIARDLAEYGILVLIPHALCSQETTETIQQISTKDSENKEFRKICFDNMEVGIDQGETVDGHPYSLRVVNLGFHLPRFFTHSYTVPPKSSFTIGPGAPFMLETPKESIELKPKRVPLDVIEIDEETRKTVNQTIYNSAHELNFDLLFSEALNAAYFTNFDVHWQLLDWKLKGLEKRLKSEGRVGALLPSILGMDLKFLDEITLYKILEIRDKEGDVFEEFRLALKESCRHIESIPYTKEFENEVRNLREKNIEPGLRKLDREFERIKKHRLARGGIIALGSIIASVLIGSPAPLAGLVLPLKEYADYKVETDRLKQNSMYFLWKVKKTK